MSDFIWTPETIDQLRTLAASGLSFSQIGAEMGLSRNAVAGKADRLEIKSRVPKGRRGQKAVAPPAKKRVPKPTPPAKVHPWGEQNRLHYAQAKPASPVVPVVASSPDAKLPASRCVKLIDVGQDCLWPLGDPRDESFRYCAAPKQVTRQYCDAHHALAYRPQAQKVGNA